ncbi:MAG: LytTR family transcriptional regulator [Gemmatimonadetes bacterium]|nr:MAG: LytTR family transcriptional regulator [Gemmatimonadota bacterium]
MREGRHIRFVPTERIRWLESERNYVVLHTETGSVRMRSTLRDLSARLDPARFVRVHRSRVVNLDHVDRVEPWFNGTYRVVLLDGTTLRVSRSYRRDLLLPAR